MTLHHNLRFSNQAHVLMLVPFGMFVHEWIVKANEGDIVECYDGVGEFVSASEISVSTALADTLSLGIYGLPIKVVMDALRANWGDRIWKDRVFLVTLRKM